MPTILDPRLPASTTPIGVGVTPDVFGNVFGDYGAQVPTDPTSRPASIIVLQGPTDRVVTADQMRSQCRIDLTGESAESDDTLYLYIDAATSYAEQRLGTSLMPQSLIATFYEGQPLDLRRGPVIGIVSVTDRNGQTATGYNLRPIGYTTRVLPTSNPSYPVSVVYRAGHVAADGTTPAVPPELRIAILMHAATLYTNKESISDKAMTPVPHSLDAFYDQRCRNSGVG